MLPNLHIMSSYYTQNTLYIHSQVVCYEFEYWTHAWYGILVTVYKAINYVKMQKKLNKSLMIEDFHHIFNPYTFTGQGTPHPFASAVSIKLISRIPKPNILKINILLWGHCFRSRYSRYFGFLHHIETTDKLRAHFLC